MSEAGEVERKPLTVVRDAVHNLVTFSAKDGQWIKAIIDRPEFQRLRRIRQLGLAFLTYPGAEHSRWSHSFGVCHVARRMLSALHERYDESSEEGRELAELRREIIAAALLHDLGHGPFSHVFERAVPLLTSPIPGYPKNHEDWSVRIINERFRETLEEFDIRTDVVAGLINKSDRNNLLAKDFISSQLDADRMDYLLRDSHAVGARYGEFDLEWLLHSIRIGKVLPRGQADEVLRLCFDSRKAIRAVEEYIQAREFMYVQVYIHKTTRAFEAILRNILGLAAHETGGEMDGAPQPCPTALAKLLAGQPLTTDEYLSLDDTRLYCTLMDWAGADGEGNTRRGQLARLCTRLVNRGRPFRHIEINPRYGDGQKRLRAAIELQVELRDGPSEYSLYLDSFEDLAYRNTHYRKSEDTEELEDQAILFVDENGHTEPAEVLSEVIMAISKIETRIHRLYYDETDEQLTTRLRQEKWI